MEKIIAETQVYSHEQFIVDLNKWIESEKNELGSNKEALYRSARGDNNSHNFLLKCVEVEGRISAFKSVLGTLQDIGRTFYEDRFGCKCFVDEK